MEFKVTYPSGSITINPFMYFVKAGLPNIKKFFKLCSEYCTEEDRNQLIAEFPNIKDFWESKDPISLRNKRSFDRLTRRSTMIKLTPNTEKQKQDLLAKLDKVFGYLQADKWK